MHRIYTTYNRHDDLPCDSVTTHNVCNSNRPNAFRNLVGKYLKNTFLDSFKRGHPAFENQDFSSISLVFEKMKNIDFPAGNSTFKTDFLNGPL